MNKQCKSCDGIFDNLSEDSNCDVCEAMIEEWEREQYSRMEREQKYLKWVRENELDRTPGG